MSEVRDRWLIRRGPPRRRPASADRLLLDGIRTLVTIVLALACLAGLGASVGATGMPLAARCPDFHCRQLGKGSGRSRQAREIAKRRGQWTEPFAMVRDIPDRISARPR
jgi:hypothetical protein